MSIKFQRALLTMIAVCVLVLLPLKEALARALYAQSCQREAWSIASCVKGFQ